MPSDLAVTLYYVNSVKCHTRLPLILQTKQTRLLTFLPPSVPNFDYILFPLDPMIAYEHWSHPIHNKKPQSGTAAATTEEVGCRLCEHAAACVVFWVERRRFNLWVSHTVVLSLPPDGFFLLKAFLLFTLAPYVDCRLKYLPHINLSCNTTVCTHTSACCVWEHMWKQVSESCYWI